MLDPERRLRGGAPDVGRAGSAHLAGPDRTDPRRARAVLHGLAAPGSSRAWNARPGRGIAARLVFWGVGFFTFPFVFMGSILFLFGNDLGARIGGIVMLVIFLPGLIALHRWAHPRH